MKQPLMIVYDAGARRISASGGSASIVTPKEMEQILGQLLSCLYAVGEIDSGLSANILTRRCFSSPRGGS